MASNFKPLSAFSKVIRGFVDVKKILVSQNPRLIRPGDALWLNKVSTRYQAEPYLLSYAYHTTDPSSSTSAAGGDSTSVADENANKAPLFLGLAAGARAPQQLFAPGSFSAPGGATLTPGDASPPFIEYYSEGIAFMPVSTTLGTGGILTSALEPGTMVMLDGFQNAGSGTNGHYNPAGILETDTNYYTYSNSVTTTSTAAQAIGLLVERGNIGDTMLVVKFQAAVFATELGGI